MAIEKMSEQKIKTEHNLEGGESLHSKEFNGKFIDSGIREYGMAMARYSLVDQGPSSGIGGTDTKLAESLSKVKIDDPNLEKRIFDISQTPEVSIDDASLLVSVFVGKTIVKENEGFLTSAEKNNLSKLADTVVDSAMDKIGSAKGKVIRLTGMLTLLTTACLAKITPSNPDLTSASEPVATEQVGAPTPVASMDRDELPRGKYGIEMEPISGIEDQKIYNLQELVTEEDWENIKESIHIEELDNGNKIISHLAPWGCEKGKEGKYRQGYASVSWGLQPGIHDVNTASICDVNPSSSAYGTAPDYKRFSLDQLAEEVYPSVVKEQTTGLSKEEMRELAQNIDCKGPDGSCVYETNGLDMEPDVSVDAICTGEIKTIDIINPENGEKIAFADTLSLVTKDKENNPQLLYIPIQLRSVENPDINIIFQMSNVLAKNSDLQRQEAYSLEVFKEIFEKGRVFRFVFYGKEHGFFDQAGIEKMFYSNPEYLEALQEFKNNGSGTKSNEPLIIFIHGFDSEFLYN